MTTIGERILALCYKQQLTTYALAKKARVPPSTLHYLEVGSRNDRVMDGSKLTIETCKRLAKALGVTLDYLAGMYDEEATP